jgi:hypothetical protein
VLVGVLALLLGVRLFGPPDPAFLGRALVAPAPALRAEDRPLPPIPDPPSAAVTNDSVTSAVASPGADVGVTAAAGPIATLDATMPVDLATTALPASRTPEALATSVPTVAPPSVERLRQRTAAVEATLQRGLFTAETEYSADVRATATLRLDLGQLSGVRRVHLITTYQRASEAQTVEYILIGNRCWQRPATGGWTTLPCQSGLWAHVQTFLPNVGAVAQADVARPDSTLDGLRWYDREAALETLLTVDSTTGIPRELRQMTPGGDLVRVVRYGGWNSPVEISPPVSP